MLLYRILLWIFPAVLLAAPYAESRAPYPPFVSGDGFRAHCDYVFDETDTSLDPRAVLPYSVVFLKGDYLASFFTQIHPFIVHPYILVTHNSDDSAPGQFGYVLDEEKLIAWFSQNVDDPSHEKMHPIPIGIANRSWAHGNGSMIEAVSKRELPKTHLLYLNVAVSTYPTERSQVFNLFYRAPFAYYSPMQSFETYLGDVASSQFVASPRGNGLDTHRFWESLYLGAYPIVKSSSLDSLYADLPVVIIQNWEEVTEEFLKQKQEEMQGQNYNLDKLKISYWTQLIDSYRYTQGDSKVGF